MQQVRERTIEIVKRLLLRRSKPRLLVFVILLFTGLAGFLASFSLLHVGISEMWLRYPIAIMVAYCVFLMLLRVWLHLQGRGWEPDFDPPDIDVDLSAGHGAEMSFEFGGGKDFGGGGAGGVWGESSAARSSMSIGSSSSTDSDFDLDLDEGWPIIIALLAIAGGIIAALYIVYIAPALLAEILVDGVLVAGLYKRVKHIEQRHWLRAAIRRTRWPALLVALFFTIAGFAMQKAVPGAHTIGDVWNHIMGN